jgi:hypothetical protein
MEPPGGIGSWGPPPTRALIDAVAKAGFNVVRIPCAWDSHANQTTHQIDPAYMARVKQVVDWCYGKGLYVIINDHWDDGWLENNIGATVDPTIDAKMNSYWTQIATAFAPYGNRLLFAAANEPNVKTAAQMSTLLAYYQTFVNAVRGANGNNRSRWLVVQGANADFDKTDALMNSLPNDPTPGRLMVEAHYYGPFQFTLMSSDASWGKMFYFWGQGYHSTTDPSRNATWGEETDLDAEFQKMYAKFASKGIPVLLGEFRAAKRANLTGADRALNDASTTYWDKYVVDSAHSHGMYPICWDTPGPLFDWTTGKVEDQSTIEALTGGPALPPPGGDGAQYCFELSAQGWVSGGAPIAGVATSTERKFAGSRSLAVNINGAAATSSVYVASPSTPAGKTIAFHVWIPSGSSISAIQPYVRDRNLVSTGKRQAIGNLKTDTWNTVKITVPSNAATPLRELGVRLTTDAKWSGTCYIDSVGW